jgi:hypothetical protein
LSAAALADTRRFATFCAVARTPHGCLSAGVTNAATHRAWRVLAAYLIALQAILGIWGGYAHASDTAYASAIGSDCSSGFGNVPDGRQQTGCDCGALCSHRGSAALPVALPEAAARAVWRRWLPLSPAAAGRVQTQAPGEVAIRGPPGVVLASA